MNNQASEHGSGSNPIPVQKGGLPAPSEESPAVFTSADATAAAWIGFIRECEFALGDHVRKLRGSAWEGRVVGFYSTKLTPRGVAVESLAHAGSVQIYPEHALDLVKPGMDLPR